MMSAAVAFQMNGVGLWFQWLLQSWIASSSSATLVQLNVSVSTVKHEIQRLLRALRSDDRHGAVAHARALGLLAEPES